MACLLLCSFGCGNLAGSHSVAFASIKLTLLKAEFGSHLMPGPHVLEKSPTTRIKPSSAQPLGGSFSWSSLS